MTSFPLGSIAIALSLCAVGVDAQDRPVAQQPIQQPAPGPADAQPGDVVVEGLRDIDQKGSAVTHQTLGSGRTSSAPASRYRLEAATIVARCAFRSPAIGLARLRAVVDGEVNNLTQIYAQDRLKRLAVACAEDGALLSFSEPALGYNFYDRGAYMIRAIQTYAPDLKLPAAQTGDPTVQARFDAREVPRNRFRLPVDRDYFRAAVCFVRLQPELSTKLVFTEDAGTTARVEAAIVNRARICVGGARHVYFDPSQFRLYLADAVYRWAVAARNVESLIPAG